MYVNPVIHKTGKRNTNITKPLKTNKVIHKFRKQNLNLKF